MNKRKTYIVFECKYFFISLLFPILNTELTDRSPIHKNTDSKVTDFGASYGLLRLNMKHVAI